MLMQSTPPGRSSVATRPARWPMVVRCVTALIGSYAAAAALAALLARLLPIDRAEATGWALILSVLLYAVIGLWCFHETRLSRVAGWVWGTALVGGALLWLLGVRP
ncbi:iron transporter [Sphingomonas melonis]|uniref:Iron transporter n=1 Tax=Sphingomonas melonis TaxID=152682 RepID=A0A7Y9FNZ8_9SPHN|nr:iron transporter [Sphingomonas melonis]NYD90788.1 hypothetical protein [Sphingomonas melonis]